jgi:peptidylprolyl isomerase
MAHVQSGDRVQIHYTARFVDGTVFASSHSNEPLQFTAGGREVIEGVSQAVLGMRAGESKLVAVTPELGFGERDNALERQVPLTELPDSVKVGDQLSARAGDRVLPVWVRELGEGYAVLDANHPLAGHNLIFEIELVSFHS